MGGKTEPFVRTMENWLDSNLFQIHTCMPGKIVTYYGHAERKAKVQPLVNPRDWQNEIIQLQPIDDVPVIFNSTNEFNIIYPLKKDDYVLLLFSENSLGNFLNSTNTTPVNADDLNRFDLGDCIALPGLWGFGTAPKPPDNEVDFFLNFQNATIQIEDKTNKIIIKTVPEGGTTEGKITIEQNGNITINDGTEPYVLGTQLDTWIVSVLLSVFNSHTHSSPAGNTGSPNTSLTAPNNYLSNEIKGK